MIGIRREDKNHWERRVPLIPDQVAELVAEQRLQVRVQPSQHRAFPAHDFLGAGAEVDEDLAGCNAVLGIKEIPVERLVAGQTYLFFSHTTKGQAHNMPMLARLLELGCTLIDYEQITDDAGRRLIFFGRQAGHAGMIDGLWTLGERLAAEGHSTPFTDLRPAHTYDNLDQARQAVAAVGQRIKREGLADGIGPLIVGVTGTGNVSAGANEILDCLPAELLEHDQLGESSIDSRHTIYRTVIDLEQRFSHVDGSPVTLTEVTSHPERLRNAALRWLPHLTVLVNGMFWVPALPRLLSLADLRTLWPSGALSRLRVIADISCDIDGAIEATVRATTPEAPVYVWDVARETTIDGVVGDGPVILAVDNLPAELPRESSQEFGTMLSPFVAALDACDWTRPLDELALPAELVRAVIVHGGRLAPRFAYLESKLRR